MKTYLELEEAETILSETDITGYPQHAGNLELFSPIPDVCIDQDRAPITTALPNKIVSESVGYFGRSPQTIIDVGCGTAINALYLAYQGHKVTALDKDSETLDWARERARTIGIPVENFVPRLGDVLDLTASDKFQGVVSTMVLHFLEEESAKKTLKLLQDITTPSGINVISVYTEENPTEELTHPDRALNYLFKLGELSLLYKPGWQIHRDYEGQANALVSRNFGQGRDVLIPNIAEIIATKFAQKPRTYMNANRQIVTF